MTYKVRGAFCVQANDGQPGRKRFEDDLAECFSE